MLERLDALIYDALFAVCGGVTADFVCGCWWADTYAIWRGREKDLTGEGYDVLAEYWQERGAMLWRAGGGPGVPYVYGLGYWRGRDRDLLCVKRCSDVDAETYLSPLHRSVVIAFVRFVRKKMRLWRR